MMFPRSLPFWLLMGRCYWKRYDGEYPWGNSVSNYLAHLNCKLVDLSCMPVVQLQPRGWFEPKYAQNILWKDIKFATKKKTYGGGVVTHKKKWKYGGVFKNITNYCIRDAINLILILNCSKRSLSPTRPKERGPKRDTKINIEIHQEIFEIIFFSRSLMLQFMK